MCGGGRCAGCGSSERYEREAGRSVNDLLNGYIIFVVAVAEAGAVSWMLVGLPVGDKGVRATCEAEGEDVAEERELVSL